MSENYKQIADKLYSVYKKSSSGKYLMERVKNLFYGRMVYDHIDDFNELYAILERGEHGSKNPLITGDIDEGSWIEKSPSEHIKVIAIQRYCSCADDNTHIYVLTDYRIPDEMGYPPADWVTFQCFTAWPRQVSKRRGYKWGDHRDIEHPSINTFRKHKFHFGYEDGRDKHYCFKYSSYSDAVEHAFWNEGRLMWGLDSLRFALNSIKNEELT